MFSTGQLVKILGTSSEIDGIVFDTPGAKVVVAVIDRTRGPVLRTVNPKTLTIREQEGPDDHALRLLMRRTPRPSSDAARGPTIAAQGRSGFKRGAAHRSTGR
ncbi:MAG: hypothetical protein ACRDLV_15960 [Solirubrobacteraceae bacterium]